MIALRLGLRTFRSQASRRITESSQLQTTRTPGANIHRLNPQSRYACRKGRDSRGCVRGRGLKATGNGLSISARSHPLKGDKPPFDAASETGKWSAYARCCGRPKPLRCLFSFAPSQLQTTLPAIAQLHNPINPLSRQEYRDQGGQHTCPSKKSAGNRDHQRIQEKRKLANAKTRVPARQDHADDIHSARRSTTHQDDGNSCAVQ